MTFHSRRRDSSSTIRHSLSIRWCRDVNTRSGCSLACSTIHCCFVYVLVELRVSSSVSHQWVCSDDAPLPSGESRWPRFPPSAVLSGRYDSLPPHVLRLIVFASRLRGLLPAGVRVRPSALPPPRRRRRRTGVWISCWPSRSSFLAHGQGQDIPGSLAIHPATLRRSTTPDDPLRLACNGASGAAPTRKPMKASSIYRFRGFLRRCVTCCLRFTTGVAARHARLASGWLAAPLPGGCRTRWIATKGFSSWHPPFQDFA